MSRLSGVINGGAFVLVFPLVPMKFDDVVVPAVLNEPDVVLLLLLIVVPPLSAPFMVIVVIPDTAPLFRVTPPT